VAGAVPGARRRRLGRSPVGTGHHSPLHAGAPRTGGPAAARAAVDGGRHCAPAAPNALDGGRHHPPHRCRPPAAPAAARPRAPLSARRPGELLHIDIHRWGRSARRVIVFTATAAGAPAALGGIMCTSAWMKRREWAYVEVFGQRHAGGCHRLPDARGRLVCGRGVSVERVMTDNGSAYVSCAFAAACARLALRHIRTRPYTPHQCQGKAFDSDAAPRVGLCPLVSQLGAPAPPPGPICAPL
jgi:hypothetical protein